MGDGCWAAVVALAAMIGTLVAAMCKLALDVGGVKREQGKRDRDQRKLGDGEP